MAWVEARTLRSGKPRYRVYWRDPAGKTHGKVFGRKRDAEAFGRVMEQWKAEGTYFDPARGRVTLAEFVESEVLVAATCRGMMPLNAGNPETEEGGRDGDATGVPRSVLGRLP